MIQDNPTGREIMFYEMDITTGDIAIQMPVGIREVVSVILDNKIQRCKVKTAHGGTLHAARPNKPIRLERIAPGLFVYQPGDGIRYQWFVAKRRDSLWYAYADFGLASIGIMEVEQMNAETAQFEYEEKDSHVKPRECKTIQWFAENNIHYDFEGNACTMNPWTVYQFARLCHELSLFKEVNDEGM